MSEERKDQRPGAEQQKEPMIDQANRPTPVDYGAATAAAGPAAMLQWGEWIKVEKELHKEKEMIKEKEHFKEKEHVKEKEHIKEKEYKEKEKEYIKGDQLKEKEAFKLEKEIQKELLKPEGFKGEKEVKPDPALEERLTEKIAARVMEMLRQQGVVK